MGEDTTIGVTMAVTMAEITEVIMVETQEEAMVETPNRLPRLLQE